MKLKCLGAKRSQSAAESEAVAAAMTHSKEAAKVATRKEGVCVMTLRRAERRRKRRRRRRRKRRKRRRRRKTRRRRKKRKRREKRKKRKRRKKRRKKRREPAMR